MSNITFKILMVLSFVSLSSTALSYSKDIAAVKSMDILPYNEAVKGFKDTVEGKVAEYVVAGDKGNILLVVSGTQKSDLVFTLGTDALRLMKDEIKGVPVVYTFVLNPESIIGSGKPNYVGIDMNIPPEDQFSALLQVVPSVGRIGVVYDPARGTAIIHEAEAAAKKLGVNLVTKKIKSSAEVVSAVNQLEGKIDALWMFPDTTAVSPETIEYMLLFSFKNRIPLIGISEKYVKNGALFALTFDSEDLGRQAGEIATRILKGEDAGSVPVYRPRKFKLSINMNTAEKLGLKISDKVVSKAKVFR